MEAIWSRQRKSLRHVVGRFARDGSGVAGIEFAVTFPILLILIAGSVDISEALVAQRKSRQIASSIAGFMADQSQWTKSEVDDLLTAGTFMIRPYKAEDLKLVVSILERKPDGTMKVAASRASGGDALAVGSAPSVEVPEDIRSDASDLVLAQVDFKLETPFSALWPYYTVNNKFEYKTYYFARPRRGADISIK